ncbi:MAG TPA: 3-dehydroquinate synthase [Fimbriimonadales bacterium]|nr:3-dehydroquinate synthase [Fimbriimonadales bacterium]
MKDRNGIEFVAGDKRYPVFISRANVADILSFLGNSESTRCFVITDHNVWKAHGKDFEELGPVKVFLAGEESKNIETWQECLVWLARNGADRKSVLVLVGGGVVSDLGGFVAATYMRGLRYVTVATSLLGQIDAALGGKTGIDLPDGKNLVGAFHHPLAVWCDYTRLNTLPNVEFRNGIVEAIKYAAIIVPQLFEEILNDSERLLSLEPAALCSLVEQCVQAKARVVAEDPEERSGRRAILNFGHTVGHALETALEYRGLSHGEAVMIGMIIESEIGKRLGITQPEVSETLQRAASVWGLPTSIPKGILKEELLNIMQLDKKVVSGRIGMALVSELGKCSLVPDISEDVILEVLKKS